MIKTNNLIKTKTITFENNAGNYSGLSFEYLQDESEAFVIKDWLNGGYSSPGSIGSFKINPEEYDTPLLNRGFSKTPTEYVKAKILQKLNIHLNEFKYRYENTEDIGIPYLDKPTVNELDLFIKEAILSTAGVKEITSFISRKATIDAGDFGKNKAKYYAEFSIKIETGDELWQSIAI
jgi:hypothetical protein